MKKILFLSLCFISFNLAAQDRYISGHITDANDDESIPAVTVIIANTTIGTTTDSEGYYQLRIPGEGSYQLSISHVGYQSVLRDIEPGTASIQFDAALQSIGLEELAVSAGVRFRRRDINLFWNTILGQNPSRRTIHATNPEAVYYFYNSETKILRVTCREPLQIVNLTTGYHIQYILESFTHDYKTGFTDWNFQSGFTELEPDNPRQQNNREKKRKEVYRVSLTKFIKSLYNNSLKENGFLLGEFREDADTLSLLSPDSILSTTTENSKTLYLDNKQMILICYGKPIDNDTVMLRQWQRYGLFCNLLIGDSIRIYPDGTFDRKLATSPFNSSKRLSGLNMRLPLDYFHEEDMEEVTAENEMVSDRIVLNFDRQLNIYPQEKIHLHTDRDVYVPGEKIWFKAYLTDAATHQPVSNSRYVYVELISPVDTLINRVMIRPTADHMYHGHLFLSEMIPEGDYTLRAYTHYMANLGDDYFFKKNIRIGNINRENVENRGNMIAGRTLAASRSDYDVSFFPEGGNLVEGVWNTVALKALNRNGYPETISGEIVDRNGTLITTLQTFHAGMGVFSYVPESGKRYFLKCKNGNGLAKQFELPQSDLRAYALSVSQQNGKILVGVRQSTGAPDVPCYLLAHCRGIVFYFDSWDSENKAIVFLEEELPAGVIQFVLFDEQMNPLSERLVFSKNYDEEQIEFHTDKVVYEKRDKVFATLSFGNIGPSLGNEGEQSQSPSPSESAGARLSISITDDADIPIDSTTTILSTLLLSSELKGYIENPAWYLQDDIKSSTALDYLMMTHGWRRYNIPEIVKGNPESPQIPFQTSQQISGKVRGLFLRPVADSEILIMTEEGGYGLATSNEKGVFMFHDFEYPDSTSYIAQALSRRGGSHVEILLDGETFPTPVYAPQSPVETDHVPSQHPNDFITKAAQRSRYDEDMQVIHLSEIIVSAPRIDPKEERRLEYWMNRSSDLTLRREDFLQRHPTYSYDILRGIAGVTVAPDGSYIGIRALGAGGEPLIFIDGVQTHYDDFRYFPVDAIESIDVIKGVIGSSLFGLRGAFGAISVVTRMGGEDEREKTNYTVFTPLGYQKPVEFYSPKYETLESKHLSIPDYRTTIFWKPDIIISEDEDESAFEFYTSDFSTTYSVVIEGLTTDGRIIRQVEKIQVE